MSLGVKITPKSAFTFRTKRRLVSTTESHGESNHGMEPLDDEDVLSYINIYQCSRIGDEAGLKLILAKSRYRKKVNTLDETNMAPLHYAARFNHFNCVKILVEDGYADPCIKDKEKATPLHYAARKKEVAHSEDLIHIIKYLSDLPKVDVNAKDKFKSTPLHFAAMRGNLTVTKTLLACEKIKIDAQDHSAGRPIHDAVTYNHIDVTKMLIENGANVRAQDKELVTPLHLAALEGNLDMVKLLVMAVGEEEGKDVEYVNMKTEEGCTALHIAVEKRSKDVVKYLIEKGAEVNLTCRSVTTGATPLHLAAQAGSVSIAEMLIDKGAEINANNNAHSRPLHLAVEFQNLGVVKLLLEQTDIELEATDNELFTPFLIACCYSNMKIVELLLSKGVKVDPTEIMERTSINLASEYNRYKALDLLLRHIKLTDPADWVTLATAPDRFGNTPMHTAAKLDHIKPLKVLLKHDLDVEKKNEDEETPFHLAAIKGNLDVCALLIKATNCSVINDEDEDSNTALHLAAQEGHVEIVTLLIDNGANIESRNCENWTPLDFAASNGHMNVVTYLLDEDAPINPIDKGKTTPLHLAAAHGFVDVVKVLLDRGADVSELNGKRRNALDLAIDNGHRDVATAIVQSDSWMMAMMHQTMDGKKNVRNTPMRKLIQKMPDVAEIVFNRCMETGPEGVSSEDKDYYIDFNYSLLDDTYSIWDQENGYDNLEFQEKLFVTEKELRSDARPYTTNTTTLKKEHPLTLILKSERDKLVFHPLVLALIRRKWSGASYVYLGYLIIYIVFLSLISASAMSAPPPYSINMTACYADDHEWIKSRLEGVSLYWIIATACIGMLNELFQLAATKSGYLQLTNLLDWYVYVSAILFVIDFTPCGARLQWQWEMGAFTVLMSWFSLLLYIRRIPRIGIYVVMLVEIFKTFLKFFCVFFLFIVSFAISFYLLLQNQDPFRTGFYSIIKSTVMMIGEMDFTDIFHANQDDPDDPGVALYYEGSTYAIFSLFLVIMSILVMNLLTGLAVEDVGALQQIATIKKIAMQTELALDIEVALPYRMGRTLKRVIRSQRFYPNKNRIFAAMSHFMEGPFSWDSIINIIDGQKESVESENQLAEVHEDLHKEIQKNSKQIKSLHVKLERIEALLEGAFAKPKSPKKTKGTTGDVVQFTEQGADSDEA